MKLYHFGMACQNGAHGLVFFLSLFRKERGENGPCDRRTDGQAGVMEKNAQKIDVRVVCNVQYTTQKKNG